MKRSMPRPSSTAACSANSSVRLACELHAGAVDPLELVLEVVLRELVAVGAERVRLDQVGAGADEARVQGDDAIRRAQVGLLWTPQSRDCAGNENAHAAVPDDDRPAGQTLLEAAAHAGLTLLTGGGARGLLVEGSRQTSKG